MPKAGCVLDVLLMRRAEQIKNASPKAGVEKSGSPGRIRTYDTWINSPPRYHCATGECVRATKKYT